MNGRGDAAGQTSTADGGAETFLPPRILVAAEKVEAADDTRAKKRKLYLEEEPLATMASGDRCGGCKRPDKKLADLLQRRIR